MVGLGWEAMAVGSLWRGCLPSGLRYCRKSWAEKANGGRTKSISDLPQKTWEAVPCICQPCSRGPVWAGCRADSQDFALLPSVFAEGRRGSPSWGAFNTGFNNSFHVSFLLTWGERGAGAGCVRETHWYGNHIFPVIYLRNTSVQGWEHSDSALAAAAAAEGTHHGLRPPPLPPARPPHWAAFPPASLRHQRRRGTSGEPLLGGSAWPLFSPRLWRSLPLAHCGALGRVWGTWGARTASFPGRKGDIQLWPGARFVTGSLQYYIGPSLPLCCRNRWQRWARWWLMPSLSARSAATFLCGRAGCMRCFTDGSTPPLVCAAGQQQVSAVCQAWTCSPHGAAPWHSVRPGDAQQPIASPSLLGGLELGHV